MPPPPAVPPPVPVPVVPSGQVWEYLLITEMILTGSVEDYGPEFQSGVKAKVAAEVQVSVSSVTASVTSASVKLVITVSLASPAERDTALTSLRSALGDAAAASAFLSVPVTSVTFRQLDRQVLGSSSGGYQSQLSVRRNPAPPPSPPARAPAPSLAHTQPFHLPPRAAPFLRCPRCW